MLMIIPLILFISDCNQILSTEMRKGEGKEEEEKKIDSTVTRSFLSHVLQTKCRRSRGGGWRGVGDGEEAGRGDSRPDY